MKPSEVLEKLDWCKGNNAINEAGSNISVRDKDSVVAVCLYGAFIYAFEGNFEEKERYLTTLEDICRSRFGQNMIRVNDYILTRKEEAIALLKEVEQQLGL